MAARERWEHRVELQILEYVRQVEARGGEDEELTQQAILGRYSGNDRDRARSVLHGLVREGKLRETRGLRGQKVYGLPILEDSNKPGPPDQPSLF
jgi:hypothetical protein